MSAEERIHTINLGKVLLSQPQHRAVRAINMIREFARRHAGTEAVKIDEDLARRVWARGARSPPRRVRVMIGRTDDGDTLVSLYDGDLVPGQVLGGDDDAAP
ncbi:MAG: 60S ribosomal protein L31, partial [Nitrosopumilus sp.]|nr:60S ribosomal protein L31 [Nitrosopumilus sp.]